MDVLKRRADETGYDYIKRIVYGKLVDKTIDVDYEELSEYIFGEGNNYNSSEVRKRLYGCKRLIEIIEKEKIKNITKQETGDQILNQIQSQKIELEKERKKLQTTKLEYNKLVRQDARIELFLEYMQEAILQIEPIDIPDHILPTTSRKVGLVNIADAHVGKQCVVKGLRGEIINEYNKDIFQSRMWDLFNEVLAIIKKENLTHIKLLTLGDMVEGILRNSQLQSLEMGVIDSVIEYADFMSKWINELSKYVTVDYHSAYGNHDGLRLLNAKSAADFPHENVGRLIDYFLKIRLETNPNVVINDNQLPYSYFDVLGMNVLVMHGEDKDLVGAVKDFTAMYGERIDMLITGHKHTSVTATAGLSPFGDIEVIRIPSLCGVDDFSVTIKKFSRAGAKVFIIEDGKGKNVTYDIKFF